MILKTIRFNTTGYDGFIDFIKAYAILCVLLGHTLGPILDRIAYGVWAGMQVPLFILIQSFHCYKKNTVGVSITRIIKRVLLPFFVLELFTFFIAFIGGGNCKELISTGLYGGGYGPGSYFPWIYTQVALLLPIFAILLKKSSKITSLIIFLVICELFELFFSYLHISEEVYRLLCPRYIFLFFFGWIWAKEGITINWLTIILSLISLASIIYFEYFSVDDEPFFFLTDFKYHRWPCYFFVANGFTALLYKLWSYISASKVIVSIIKVLASASYEIFLVQMTAIFLIKPASLSFISNQSIQFAFWLITIWSLSLVGGVIIHLIINKKRINDIR